MKTGAIQVDNRIGGKPRYYFSDPDAPLVNVPDEIRKCVLFVGHKQTPHSRLSLSGTAFLLGIEDRGESFVYLVTAAHVLEGMAERGHDDAYIRVNTKGGATEDVPTAIRDWKCHTNRAVDVAVHPWEGHVDFDCLFYPVSESATAAIMKREGMGIGDEVFMTGLYTRHAGRQRNVPIVRIGNLAAMPEEPCLTNRGPVGGYLVEIRSIGGISGSPVFIRPFPIRVERGRVGSGPHVFYLLGLMHGKWDMKQLEPIEFEIENDLPSAGGDPRLAQPLNSGIGVVVPVERIMEVVHHPDLVALRDEAIRDRDESESTTPD